MYEFAEFAWNSHILFFFFFFFQSVFGLPCSTTCDNYMLKKKLQPGFNVDIIQQAASLYNGAPVIEASDEARALRYISFIFFNRDLNSLII